MARFGSLTTTVCKCEDCPLCRHALPLELARAAVLTASTPMGMGESEIVCGGCGQVTVCVDCLPWQVTVRAPDGTSHTGGEFCSSCMVEFAKLGLRLYKKPYEPPQLRRITDPTEIAAIQARLKGTE